jgi:hypothetical protein
MNKDNVTLSEEVANIVPSLFKANVAIAVWWASINYVLEPLSKWTTLTVPIFFSGAANTQTSLEGETAHMPF